MLVRDLSRWQPPAGLPLLMRTVTRVLPIFRRWPTTYRWRAEVTLVDELTMTSRWQRTEPPAARPTVA